MIGLLLEKLERFDQAKQYYEKAIQINRNLSKE